MTTTETTPTAEDLYPEWEQTIRSIARQQTPFDQNGLTYDDLVQTGAVAFLTAFKDWDLNHPGHKAWMRRVIQTAVLDELRSKHNSVRLPSKVWRLRSAASKAEVELAQTLLREPTIDEMARAVDASPDSIAKLRCKTAPPQSLDETRPENNTELALQLADPDSWEMADKLAVRLERQQHVARILDGLPTMTADVVRLRYGLDIEGYELDNSELAAHFGKSTEWVRLRLREAERHIRHVGLDRTRRRDLELSARDIQALLSKNDLSWYNLTGVDFQSAELQQVNLSRANLANADLTKANLTEANLTRTDLTKANLTEANLTRTDLPMADLSGADLNSADLSEADLFDADLSESNLVTSELSGADLRNVNLSRANLSGANLNRANLNGANLSGANLKRANLRGANLNRANLNGANLSEANLYECDLRSADLRGADIHGVDLRGTNLRSANLTGVSLSDALDPALSILVA